MGAIFFETIMHDEIAQLDGWAGSQKVDNFQENQRGIDALPAKAKWKFFSIPLLHKWSIKVLRFAHDTFVEQMIAHVLWKKLARSKKLSYSVFHTWWWENWKKSIGYNVALLVMTL